MGLCRDKHICSRLADSKYPLGLWWNRFWLCCCLNSVLSPHWRKCKAQPTPALLAYIRLLSLWLQTTSTSQWLRTTEVYFSLLLCFGFCWVWPYSSLVSVSISFFKKKKMNRPYFLRAVLGLLKRWAENSYVPLLPSLHTSVPLLLTSCIRGTFTTIDALLVTRVYSLH